MSTPVDELVRVLEERGLSVNRQEAQEIAIRNSRSVEEYLKLLSENDNEIEKRSGLPVRKSDKFKNSVISSRIL